MLPFTRNSGINNKIRHYTNLYAKLIKDDKRYVSLIVKKMR